MNIEAVLLKLKNLPRFHVVAYTDCEEDLDGGHISHYASKEVYPDSTGEYVESDELDLLIEEIEDGMFDL